MLVAGLGIQAQRKAARTEHGRLLFLAGQSGSEALRGRLAGHAEDLPLAATRCVNCHVAPELPAQAPTTAQAASAAGASNRFGPVLSARSLANAFARRGGPVSVYDAAALCKLLREGIDPAWIMINQGMPRYSVTDAQCAHLWTYLTRS